MKKQLLPLLLFVVLVQTSFASNLVWAHSMNQTSNNTGYVGTPRLQQSTNGGLLTLTGTNNTDTLNLDLQGGFVNGIIPGVGTTQYALAKYDFNGVLQWHHTWTSVGTSTLNINSYAQRASDGHIFLYGSFGTALDADPGAGVVSLTTGTNGAIFLIETDSTGNYVWSGQINSAGSGNSAVQVAVNASGNIILTGDFESSINVDFLSTGGNLSSASGAGNSFIATYDVNHQMLWFGAIAGAGNNYGNITCVAINPNNNDIYVSGTLYGTANFNLLGGTFNVTGVSTQDAFIAQYDSNGVFSGDLDMGTTGSSAIYEMQYINGFGGELLVNGSTNGSINLNAAGGGYVFTSPSFSIYHGFVARYGQGLDFKWAGSFTSATNKTQIFSPRFDPQSGLSMIVETDTTFNANPGAGINNVVIGSADVVVLLDYYTGAYITNFNYQHSPGYPGFILPVNGNLYMSGGFLNSFNAALNGDSDILNNPYISGNQQGSPFMAAYNFLEVQPSVQVSDLHVTTGTDTTVTVVFTPGNGEQRLVMVLKDAPITDVPANGNINWYYDPVYGLGYQYPNGAFGVYLDSGQSLNLTGIDTAGGHQYYFKAFEVNGGFVNGVSEPTANFNLQNAPTTVYPAAHVSTGVAETATDKMDLYPNPAKDILNLYTTFIPAPKTMLRILNVTGQVVAGQAALSSQQQRIQTQALSSGIYFVEIENDGARYTSKFVKQ